MRKARIGEIIYYLQAPGDNGPPHSKPLPAIVVVAYSNLTVDLCVIMSNMLPQQKYGVRIKEKEHALPGDAFYSDEVDE